VDTRNNGGGNDALARIIAGRFATEARIFRYIRWRTAPGANGFGDYIADYIEPLGGKPYTKPVILLTNRRVFSSAESLVEMMRVQPNVTVIGDTTGGGSGNPAFRTLPNGFVYRIPRWIAYTPDKRTYEGIGLPPDIAVRITPADSLAGRDVILEAALQRIR
jgi:C-terminal processing protease CtpA/Prc